MCLIITELAALISFAVWFFDSKSKEHKTGMLVLMYLGASVMWSVDGFFALSEGEPFFDLSLNDALLGILVVVCGLILYSLIMLSAKVKSRHKAHS